MLKKIDRGRLFLEKHADFFECPLCHQPLTYEAKGLRCENNHQYDLSKKGTLYFLDHQIKTDYDRFMFIPRRRMLQSGMYQPLLDEIAIHLQKDEQLLDVGCGEGSFLQQLISETMTAIGFDIAKEGVYLATDHTVPAFWCVADLTKLPFREQTFSTILNIFSPSNYQEFRRILKPEGQVIKVVPGSDYLKELRQAFYPENHARQSYSNEKVVEKFCAAYPQNTHKKLYYSFEVPEAYQQDLLEMSPLEWGAAPERKEALKKAPLKKITLDLEVLIGKIS